VDTQHAQKRIKRKKRRISSGSHIKNKKEARQHRRNQKKLQEKLFIEKKLNVYKRIVSSQKNYSYLRPLQKEGFYVTQTVNHTKARKITKKQLGLLS